MPPIPKRNLLICLDAFGTVFTPREPIATQYGRVARSLGIDVEDDEIMKSFKNAFKEESKLHPNYGKEVGLGSEKWWTNVITKTFAPHYHDRLAPTLIDRFNSKEGYTLYPDVLAYIRQLSSSPNRHCMKVGVITNSDNRVPDVLNDLGLRINQQDNNDIDFAIMSYDVGVEKPDRRIFDAATDLLDSKDDWDLVYIGDEPAKDAKGALNAGWSAIIVDRDASDTSVGYKIMYDGREVDVISDFSALKNLKARWPLITG